MPEIVRPKGRGRPKRAESERVQTKIWMEAVRCASGLSPYLIEKTLQPASVQRRDGMVIRPRLWDRYAAGTATPTDRHTSSAVALADARWLGTASWFRSPVWRALHQLPFAQHEAEALLARLPTLSAKLFTPSSLQRKRTPADAGLCAEIGEAGTFEALAAVLVWAREAEVIASPELRAMALHAYRQMQPSLEQIPEIAPHAQDLFFLIDTTVREWIYPDPGRRLQAVFFSHELRSGGTWPPEVLAQNAKELLAQIGTDRQSTGIDTSGGNEEMP